MSTMNSLPSLLPGDHLLYYTPHSFVDWAIAVKTWSPAAHIEIFIGAGQSVASRNGIGVGQYPLRGEGLVAVLRPRSSFDAKEAAKWFATVDGQGYDWTALFGFYLMVKSGSSSKQFCSEFSARWDDAAGIPSFHESWDRARIAPGDYLMSTAFDWIWTDFGDKQ
jgi:hypothetical protein